MRIRFSKTKQAICLAALFLACTVPARVYAQADELAELRASTAQYHRLDKAIEAGYDLRPGLTHCVAKPGVGAMGYHFFNQELIDDIGVDLLRPEAVVYAPGPNGTLHLAALEYVVPIDAWHAAGNTEPPMVLGMHMHPGPNPALRWYIFHVWVWRHNPAGMFEDWNPAVTCD